MHRTTPQFWKRFYKLDEATQKLALKRAFQDSVDDYLEFCEARGEEPDKPFSGRLMLRLPPELHRKVYTSSKLEGKSLNQWIAERLEAS